jgi:hypothetical protein
VSKPGPRPAAPEDRLKATTVRYKEMKMAELERKGYSHTEAYAIGVETLLRTGGDAEEDLQAWRQAADTNDQALRQALATKGLLEAQRERLEKDALQRYQAIAQDAAQLRNLDPRNLVHKKSDI